MNSILVTMDPRNEYEEGGYVLIDATPELLAAIKTLGGIFKYAKKATDRYVTVTLEVQDVYELSNPLPKNLNIWLDLNGLDDTPWVVLPKMLADEFRGACEVADESWLQAFKTSLPTGPLSGFNVCTPDNVSSQLMPWDVVKGWQDEKPLLLSAVSVTWDTTDEDDSATDKPDLPKIVFLDHEVLARYEDLCDPAIITDYLSDSYDWLVKGWAFVEEQA